ncbi:MAG: DUF2171 domain-containing protein, partial [Sphingomicrobium sp.]
ERPRWRDDRSEGRFRGGSEDRGFFERAGDEIASWFGDDDAERRRDRDQRFEGRDRDWRRDEDRGRTYGRERGFDRGDRDDGGFFSDRGYRGGGYSGGGAYRGGAWGTERERGGEFSLARGRRPMFGGYTASEGPPSGYSSDRTRDWERGGFSERGPSSLHDPHYESWRRRQIDDLDRDYEDYRRENQARFESDFGSWRERRMQKRGLLSQIREHMEVVGNDDQHVGTVDRVAGDRIILTKSDPESGGAHHSLSCADVDRIDGDRLVLDCSAEQARERWRDESRSRALFEREDQGEMGDRALDRSFSGTYR